MKSIIKLVGIVLVFTSLQTSLINNTLAWDDCPHGLENDPYPGDCNKYIDTNDDGFCDHSQSDPNGTTTNSEVGNEKHEDAQPNKLAEEEFSVEIPGSDMKTMTIQEVADFWGIDSNTLLQNIISKYELKGAYKTSDILDTLREESKFAPREIKEIAENILVGNSDTSNSKSLESPSATGTTDSKTIIGLAIIITPLVIIGGYVLLKKVKIKFV